MIYDKTKSKGAAMNYKKEELHCIYGEKSESHDKEVVTISTYEEFAIMLGVAMLIIEIIKIERKK